jgi:hypothetical protein
MGSVHGNIQSKRCSKLQRKSDADSTSSGITLKIEIKIKRRLDFLGWRNRPKKSERRRVPNPAALHCQS